MKSTEPITYNMMVSAGMPGEYQVKLISKEGGMFRILLSATSLEIPSLQWLISCYEQGLNGLSTG